MNKIKNLLAVLFIMAMVASLTACGGSDGPAETDQDRKIRQLASDASNGKTWNVTQYAAGGETETLTATTINFNKSKSFTISGAAALPNTRTPLNIALPSSGTWAFASATNFNTITLTPAGGSSDAVTLNNVVITDNSLTFEYAGILVKPQEDPITVQVTAVP